ncbi:cytochrome P450 [Streptomyces vilmorinianum]|uniref:cytochrome P450 n=1 Tax=Streptomyces vilmorinianum TaxID=3051092 RepID=UPI0010FBAB7D|nr:cytochrome P450 [Streptomyces vilmorinianum]
MTPDHTAALLLKGYAWLPDLRRRSDGALVRTRVLGRPAFVLRGPGAVAFFYDERHVRRHGALPGPVLDTLFGRGAVHTLDGAPHRARKALFVAELKAPAAVADLVDRVRAEWRRAFAPPHGREVVLFDEAALVLARAVCAWSGLALTQKQTVRMAHDCVAMVDGFATPGPRHLRARRARARQEKVLARLVEEARAGAAHAPGTPFDAVVRHHDADGETLDARTAAVELLNIVRPTVAIAWYVVFAAHAMDRWPGQRQLLREDVGTYLEPYSETYAGSYAEPFAHEVRRFYPFVPFIGGLAAADLRRDGRDIPAGTLLLLDVYGQNHDPELWHDPYRFDPERFLRRPPLPDELIPQGGGDAKNGHRCPGEDITVAVLAALATELARLEYTVPAQDLKISLRRIPTRPRSGFRFVPHPE